MNDISYEGKRRYQQAAVADSYDSRRFKGLKGRLTDRREKYQVLRALDRAKVRGPVLDVPCGTGRMTELLLSQGYQVTAADISEAMMEHARQRNKRYGNQVQFVECDIEDLDFPDDSFDLILTIRLLHHIPPRLHPKVLGELHRVTRKWLVITFSNRYTIQSMRRDVGSLLNKSPRYSISPALFKQEVALAGFEIFAYLPMLRIFSESVTVLLGKK